MVTDPIIGFKTARETDDEQHNDTNSGLRGWAEAAASTRICGVPSCYSRFDVRAASADNGAVTLCRSCRERFLGVTS